MATPKYDIQSVNYHHLILEGCAEEVGRQLAQLIANLPGGRDYATSGNLHIEKTGFSSFGQLWEISEACCPGITGELQGFADYFQCKPQQLPFWEWTFAPALGGGNCSQVAVPAPRTHSQSPLVGRSYEWNHHEEDLKLITTRTRGKASHLGFSCLLHGRHDGMNEYGVVVSMTGGGIFGVKFSHPGPMFWLVIRSLLDNCRSTAEALRQLADLPMTGYFSLLIADVTSHFAIVEIADGMMQTREFGPTEFGGPKEQQKTSPSRNQLAFSVNHFRLDGMQAYNKLNCGIITHSQMREELIKKWGQGHTENITLGQLRQLFSKLHPEGLCNHFYNDGFGTLWSILFDLKALSAEICFGAPTHNPYHTFTLQSPPGIEEYAATIPITEWY